MRFGDKQFDVHFNGKVLPKQMIDAVKRVKKSYKVFLAKPVDVKVESAKLDIHATSNQVSYKKGAKGKIQIILNPKAGQTIGGKGLKATKVVLSGDDAISLSKTSKELQGKLKGKESIVLPIAIKKKASKGVHNVTVTVHYEAKGGGSYTSKFVVPVYTK